MWKFCVYSNVLGVEIEKVIFFSNDFLAIFQINLLYCQFPWVKGLALNGHKKERNWVEKWFSMYVYVFSVYVYVC